MPAATKEAEPIRRSITLPADLSHKIDEIAAKKRTSVQRAIVTLLLEGIDGYEKRRAAFMEVADRFQRSTDPAETEKLRDELLKMTFGD